MYKLTWWQCDNCDTLNHPTWVNCKKCFKTATKLPLLDQIIYEQQLLFDGFIRTMKKLTIDKTIPSELSDMEVINLCNEYYTSDIKFMLQTVPKNMDVDDRKWYNNQATKQQKEIYVINFVATQYLYEHANNLIAYKLFTLLIHLEPDDADLHHSLATAAERLNVAEIAATEYELTINLDDIDAQYWFDYGTYLQSQGEYSLSLDHIIKAVEINQ